MSKKFIFIDIDGTLYDHEANCIPKSALDALHKAKENDHHLFICTGRPLPDIEPIYYTLPVSGMILSCGAHILIDNKTIYHSQFPRTELKKIVDFLLTNKIGFSLEGIKRNFLNHEAYDFFHSYVLPADNKNSELARALLKERDMYHFSEIAEQDYEQILKIALFSRNRQACEQLMDQLPSNVHGFINEQREQELVTGEISIKGVNKATGIDHILNHYHHDIKHTISIGDSQNDLEMIEHTEIGICMGNGSDKLKEKADYITDSIDKQGLFNAFKNFHII